MFYKILISIALLIIFQTVHADYFLCGPDEDGCLAGSEQYCTCTPIRDDQNKPYCLDLHHLTCNPVSLQPDCQEKEIVVDDGQGACLAMLLQSVETPACRVVTESFCKAYSVPICADNGNPDTCK